MRRIPSFSSVPGQRPVLIFHSPDDYWHKPAQPPDEAWLECFGPARHQHPASRARRAACGSLPYGLHRRAPARTAQLGRGRHQSRASAWSAAFRPRRQDALRAGLPAGSQPDRRPRPAGRPGTPFWPAPRSTRSTSPTWPPVACAKWRPPITPSLLSTKVARCCTTRCCSAVAPDESRSLLIDAGGAFRGYASDITRTFTRDQAATSPHSWQGHGRNSSCSSAPRVRAGVDWRDIHLQSYRLIAGSLLVPMPTLSAVSADEAVDSALVSVFYPHGIGHLLGLQVHDVAGLHEATKTAAARFRARRRSPLSSVDARAAGRLGHHDGTRPLFHRTALLAAGAQQRPGREASIGTRVEHALRRLRWRAYRRQPRHDGRRVAKT